MKVPEIEKMINNLEELSKFADKQSYDKAVIINQNVTPCLTQLIKEKERLETDKIVVNCPQIYLITYAEAVNLGTDLVELTNKKLQELINNDFKIIDYNVMNIYDCERSYSYIKYTN